MIMMTLIHVIITLMIMMMTMIHVMIMMMMIMIMMMMMMMTMSNRPSRSMMLRHLLHFVRTCHQIRYNRNDDKPFAASDEMTMLGFKECILRPKTLSKAP